VETSNEKTKFVNDVNFKIQYDSFATLLKERRKRGFGVGWTNVFYSKFHEVVPTCALVFKEFARLAVEAITFPFGLQKLFAKVVRNVWKFQ
jgi:hypothetical protein